jgi:hypothetical protein
MITVCNGSGDRLIFKKEAFAIRATLLDSKTGTGADMFLINGSVWWYA